VKKKILLAIILSLSNFLLFAQPDCMITFRYKGIVISNNSKITSIGLPNTSFLMGYEKKEDDHAFSRYIPADSLIDCTLCTHLSSDFCRDTNSIIKYVFKNRKEGYLIKVKTQASDTKKAHIFEIIIPLDTIKFTTEVVENRRRIVVDLGAITL